MIVTQGKHSQVPLPAGHQLTVIADANSSGIVYRTGAAQTAVAAGETVVLGPFATTQLFDVVPTVGFLTHTNAPANPTQLPIDGGTIEISATKDDSGSFQPIAADLEIDAGGGSSGVGDTDFLAPIMGNVSGDALTETHNYIAGVIGANSLTGTRGSELPVAAVMGVLMDGSINADAIVLAHIDGGDPSTQTNARAAFGVSQVNNNAASSVDYGLDLYDAPSSDVNTLLSGTAEAFKVAKALLRSPNQICLLEGAGVPVDGTTGDNFAAVGSLYIDRTNAEVYVNAGTITDSVWKKLRRDSDDTIVALSSANILALSATPKQIIPAPGANKIVILESLLVEMTRTSTAYANGGALEVRYENSSGALAAATFPASLVTGGAGVAVAHNIGLATILTPLVNKAIVLLNADAPFITGTGTGRVLAKYHTVNAG